MAVNIIVLSEAYSERYKSIINSEVYLSDSSRPILSQYPSMNTGLDQGRFLSPASPITRIPSQDVDAIGEEGRNSPIRMQLASVSNDTESDPEAIRIIPRSVLVQVDHLKSLITVARAQRETESNRSHQLVSIPFFSS